MTSTRLVVFDCDGTLIDSQHMIVAAMAHAFESHGFESLPRAKVLSIVGLSLHEAISALLIGAQPELRSKVAESYKDAFSHLRARRDLEEPLFPEVRAVLEQLSVREDLVLGIATGKSQKGLRHALEHHDLTHFFTTLQTADDAPSKPHPGMLERAMAETGIDAANTVLIGDTIFDVLMARGAGAFALGVDWGYHHSIQLEAAGAHKILTSFSEIHKVLDGLWPGARLGLVGATR